MKKTLFLAFILILFVTCLVYAWPGPLGLKGSAVTVPATASPDDALTFDGTNALTFDGTNALVF